MYKDNKKDISKQELNYVMFSFISSKIDVVIIGGGKAAYIKAKGLINKGCNIIVVSPNIDEKFKELELQNIKIIRDFYKKEYIIDGHIVIIAIDDEDASEQIIYDCKELKKIFINSMDYKKGMGIVPSQDNIDSIAFASHTTGGNPLGGKLACGICKRALEPNKEYFKHITNIRNNLKKINYRNRREVLDFIVGEDYRYFYNISKSKIILNLFFGEEVVKDFIEENKK